MDSILLRVTFDRELHSPVEATSRPGGPPREADPMAGCGQAFAEELTDTFHAEDWGYGLARVASVTYEPEAQS